MQQVHTKGVHLHVPLTVQYPPALCSPGGAQLFLDSATIAMNYDDVACHYGDVVLASPFARADATSL